MRVGGELALAGEVGEDDVGPELADEAGEAADVFLGADEGAVVFAEEVDVLEAEDAAGPADLILLHLRSLFHHAGERVGFGYRVALEQVVADHLVVDAGAVGEDDAADPVAAFGVVGHGASGLVEDVGGVGAYGEESKLLVSHCACCPWWILGVVEGVGAALR